MLDMRSIQRIIEMESFEKAYVKASEIEQESIAKAIDRNDLTFIELWMRKAIKNLQIIEEYSMKDLRDIAKKLGVKDYSLICKSSLLSQIIGRQNEQRRHDLECETIA